MVPPHLNGLLVLLLLLGSSAPSAEALLRIPTLLSLSHSLLHRVAYLRSGRGDDAGADRARAIADRLRLLGPGGLWSLAWDYARNYAWRGALGEVPPGDAWELLSGLGEFGRARSDQERATWIARNYSKMVSLLGSVLRGFVRGFYRSGPLRETVMILQNEVAEGNLLRDCMEVGAKDLEGLATIAKELFFGSTTANHEL